MNNGDLTTEVTEVTEKKKANTGFEPRRTPRGAEVAEDNSANLCGLRGSIVFSVTPVTSVVQSLLLCSASAGFRSA